MSRELSLVDVPIQLLDLAADDDDSRWDVGDVHGLAQSIREVGLLQPIGVRRLDTGRFQVVHGHRRVAAISSLGWMVVSAVVLPDEPERDLLKSLVENIQRRQLSRAERADALERLLETGLGGKEIARRCGLSPNVTWSWLKVARSRVLVRAMRNEQIGIHEARQMASLSDDVVVELLPELQDKPDQWKAARIARAVDDNRTRPPNGNFKKHAETHVRRSLELVLEHMKSIKEIRSPDELSLIKEIIGIVGRWSADVRRVEQAPP